MQPPTTQTIYDLFNGRIQFLIPVYQRAYVWNEADNWSLLWEDIADIAERHLGDPTGHAQYRHFLGPIVLDQQYFEAGGVDLRLVIDGQQRLTTLQIILSAAATVATELGADDAAREVRELVLNRGIAAAGDRRYKVWPSRRDREPFLKVINDGPAAQGGAIPAAWRFFRDMIANWITLGGAADDDSVAKRLSSLRICLDSLLYVVSINLDESDNAQVIFETLNARGTGLGALDLVKNATFLQAEREGAPAEALHDLHWEPTFEADDYWVEETRQGREKRPRSDWFLMHWLAVERGRVIRADQLFDTFRREVLRTTPVPVMHELVPRLCADARTMRSFDAFEPGTREALFFSRLDAMDTTTMLPVALLLFRTEELTPERRARGLWALESWLVRRAILRLTSQNYNRVLSSLINALKLDPAKADECIVRELRTSQATTAIWPGDDDIRLRVEGGDVYGYIGQSRVRMILEACELDIRDPAKTEAIALPAGLSIEHALPQSWETNWPTDEGPEADLLRANRAAHVNRLGNLTLVTQPLNSSMSNAGWTGSTGSSISKRLELSKRSVLLINQQLCAHDIWNEEMIDQRGADLTERVLRTWPGPESKAWPVTEPPVASL